MSRDGIVVLFRRGPDGAAALAEGARLARSAKQPLTVLALAPQDTDPALCGVYTEAFNEGVRAEATGELAEARRLLGEDGRDASYVLLLVGRDPALESWVARERPALVLLARGRPLAVAARRRAGRLRRAGVEVRLIGRRA